MSVSASAISEMFVLALTSLKKSCALARAHNLTSARSERRSNEWRSPKLWQFLTNMLVNYYMNLAITFGIWRIFEVQKDWYLIQKIGN